MPQLARRPRPLQSWAWPAPTSHRLQPFLALRSRSAGRQLRMGDLGHQLRMEALQQPCYFGPHPPGSQLAPDLLQPSSCCYLPLGYRCLLRPLLHFLLDLAD